MSTPPTLIQLFELEALVPAAATEIMDGLIADLRTIYDATTMPRTMHSTQFLLGSVTGREGLRGVIDRPRPEFCEYQGVLEINLGIAREANTTPAETLTTSKPMTRLLAATRARFLNHPPPFAQKLPYWQVTEIRPLATAYDPDSESDIDFATLSWQLTLCVLPGNFAGA